MNGLMILFAIGYEVVAFLIIYKLWSRKRQVGIVERCLLTVILLIPFFGFLIYAFLAPPPDGHPYDLNEHYDGRLGSDAKYPDDT